MNWIEHTIWIQRFFFCAVTAQAAGNAFVIILLVVERIGRWKNSRLLLPWMKCAQILFLIPIAGAVVIGSRMDVTSNGILWISDFWTSTSPEIQKIYFVIICIWMAGLGFGIIFRAVQYYKLKYIIRGNIPVEDEVYLHFFDIYKEKFKMKKVRIFQNDLTQFPITFGLFHPRIILPVLKYAEKELHMILEHEMNHIRNRDLFWKKVGILNTFLHWWNPFVYILLKKLILQEEIECDIKTCENNCYFTMKEYGMYLSGMNENYDDMVFTSALCKSKKDLFRRLEGMVRGKKYKKWIAAVSCLVLSFLSVVPSYAASEGMARLNDKWIRATEIGKEVEPVDYRALETKEEGQVEDHIEELDLTEENNVSPMGSEITLDYTVKANTRVLYRWQEMKKGDKVFVDANCSDSSIVYRIGIKKLEGDVTYIQGSGSLTHVFEIEADGEYTVYVENRSSKSMNVTGRASYPN